MKKVPVRAVVWEALQEDGQQLQPVVVLHGYTSLPFSKYKITVLVKQVE